jgi:hypothetical protein
LERGVVLENFAQEFTDLVAEKNVDWKIRGLLTQQDTIFPFGSDTKVLSTIFELFCAPLIREIAQKHNLQVIPANQTIYPDFTLMRNEADRHKIAIDIKTTYRPGDKANGQPKNFWYTLGSYTSFIRNNTKNITYPFNQYDKHWIIGFLYSRRPDYYNDDRIYGIGERNELHTPYNNVEFFVQEKYKIAGERPGSGNTTNIASFPCSSIEPLKNGQGPFAEYGEEVFLEYWRNFEPKAANRPYNNLQEFLNWQNNQ